MIQQKGRRWGRGSACLSHWPDLGQMATSTWMVTKEKDADSGSQVSQPTVSDTECAMEETKQDRGREGSWFGEGTFEQKADD